MNPKQTLSFLLLLASLIPSNSTYAMDVEKKFASLIITKVRPETKPEKRKAKPLKEAKKNIKRPKKDLRITRKRPSKTKANHFNESDEEQTTKQRKQDPGISFEECAQENISKDSPYLDFDDHLPEGSPDLIKVDFIDNSITLIFKVNHSDETFEIPIESFPFFITRIEHIRILPGVLPNSMTIVFTLKDDTKNDHKFKSENISFSDFVAVQLPQKMRK